MIHMTSTEATGISLPKNEIRKGDIVTFPKHAHSTVVSLRVTSIKGNTLRGSDPGAPEGWHGWFEYNIGHVHNVTLLDRKF